MTIAVFLGSLLLAMALGMPIAFALLASGVALMWQLDLFDAQILAQNLIGGADSFPLLAVPFFMLAGEIMNAGGLSRRIVALALALVGLFHEWLHPGSDPHLEVSQEEIANLSGLSRQRCNAALRRLASAGLLRIEYGGITVTDLDGLRRRIDG